VIPRADLPFVIPESRESGLSGIAASAGDQDRSRISSPLARASVRDDKRVAVKLSFG
jgi:hypothetical protein